MATSITDVGRRNYGQYCGIARALDLVGERWTLLVVRDLIPGPLRYNDLLAGLPGIGTNLLAKRLKDLGEAGIVERQTLPPPANVSVYALTPAGRRLERAVIELGRFGGHYLPQRVGDESVVNGRTVATGLHMTFRAENASGAHKTYVLHLDDHAYVAEVDDGRLAVRQDDEPAAHLTIRTSARLMLELLSGSIAPRDALRSTDFEINATDSARRAPERVVFARLNKFVDLFGWATVKRAR